MSKISGSLLDRIDIHIEIESSASEQERVLRARRIQLNRYREEKKLYANAQMPSKLIRIDCAISAQGQKLLESAIEWLGLSSRAHDRMLKRSRTIADLEGAKSTRPRRLSEAIEYRTLDRTC